MYKFTKLSAVFVQIGVVMTLSAGSLYANQLNDSLPTVTPSAEAMTTAATGSSAHGAQGANAQESEDTMKELSTSFAEVAALGQKISLANKQIQALQMQRQLDELKTASSQKTLGFKILRIEGFGSVLYAILRTDAGGIIQVGPGERVDDQYRVAMITSNSVRVYGDGKTYAVPFYESKITESGRAPTPAPSAGVAVEQGQ